LETILTALILAFSPKEKGSTIDVFGSSQALSPIQPRLHSKTL